MKANASNAKPTKRNTSPPEDVEIFLSSFEHPYKQEIPSLREVILAADPSIIEGIKWKVPSFRTSEHFTTMHLRAKRGVGVILHFGAKNATFQPLGSQSLPHTLYWSGLLRIERW